MTLSTREDRRRLQELNRSELARHQLSRLNGLLAAILPSNRFYREKLAGAVDLRRAAAGQALSSLDELARLPFTFKDELHDLPPGELAANLTFDRSAYVRYHQTSGTRGRPLAVLDTAEDWREWIECWQFVLDAAEVAAGDTVLMAFSFGPFIGFWSAHDAAAARGCLVVPGGGLSTRARLDLARSVGASVMLSTPSYALHMAEVAGQHQLDARAIGVRKIILAGEPGGSIPAVRRRLEEAWGAEVFDHAGATEVGPWGCAERQARGLHVLESHFIAEFLSVASGQPAAEGELAELVLTNLWRAGSPVLRYKTGDLARPTWRGSAGFVLLEGGVLGRADDMLIVRGVNVFPSAIDGILRSFPEVVEYRVTVTREAEMDQLRIEIEDRLTAPERVADELQLRLGLRTEVTCVPLLSLPRFEGKGRRFVDLRN